VSELLTFATLGFHHIADVSAADHILFLLALAVVYRGRDWRDALWVVSAFTIGHSITLALSVTDTLVLPQRVVEFLIPLTILATAIENIAVRDHAGSRWARYRMLFAGVFGLVHGAGFASYLRSLFMDQIAVPLVGFNLGIEGGQLAVLAVIALALAALDVALRRVAARMTTPPAYRLRVVGLSAVIALVATVWAVERRPW
jgi:HupE / UreJ protein